LFCTNIWISSYNNKLFLVWISTMVNSQLPQNQLLAYLPKGWLHVWETESLETLSQKLQNVHKTYPCPSVFLANWCLRTQSRHSFSKRYHKIRTKIPPRLMSGQLISCSLPLPSVLSDGLHQHLLVRPQQHCHHPPHHPPPS